MTRRRSIDYRRLALRAYAHVCVFCGFGIKDVLEVAHLDGQPGNNALGNLALLCPTCHRMLDIDLIPTEVVARLRDEKRTARWAKLQKDAGRNALATKKRIPGLLSQAAKAAAETRRKRRAAAASHVAAATRTLAPRVLWTISDELPATRGHGVEFLVQSSTGRRLVGWLEGFEWLRSEPREIEVLLTKDRGLLPSGRLVALKKAIQKAIDRKEPMSGDVCKGVTAWING